LSNAFLESIDVTVGNRDYRVLVLMIDVMRNKILILLIFLIGLVHPSILELSIFNLGYVRVKH
jgi:hypothetical protein